MARKGVLKPHEILDILNDLPESSSEGEDDPRCFDEDSDFVLDTDDSSNSSSDAASNSDNDDCNLTTVQGESSSQTSEVHSVPNTSTIDPKSQGGAGKRRSSSKPASDDGPQSKKRQPQRLRKQNSPPTHQQTESTGNATRGPGGDVDDPGQKRPQNEKTRPKKGHLKTLDVDTVLDSPDGTKWKVIASNCPSSGRGGQQNVLRENPEPSPYAKRSIITGLVSSAWRLIIDDRMLKLIQKCTVAEAYRVSGNNDLSLSLCELDAFLGILYVRGALESKGMEVDLLWSEKYGVQLCKDAMPRNRFREIMRFLRFDDKTTRSVRLKDDKFALISEIWNAFIMNCQSNYVPGAYLVVDEQLFPSKARCRFTQFMASKPDKYGQKFWLAVDNETKYLVNAFPYLRKDEQRPDDDRLGDYVVKKLVEPYINKGRNVSCDNFFTSLHLAEHLNAKKTSLVGTVNKIRREVPHCVKQASEKLYESKILKKGDVTLTVYQGKARKNVVLMSTLHPDVQIGDDSKSKPDTATFYNKTKFGVDVVDQMCRKYSVKSPSRRWPYHTFCNILDLAGINSWILYRKVTQQKISRRDFVLTLGKELTKEICEKRTATVQKRVHPSHISDTRVVARFEAPLAPKVQKVLTAVPVVVK